MIKKRKPIPMNTFQFFARGATEAGGLALCALTSFCLLTLPFTKSAMLVSVTVAICSSAVRVKNACKTNTYERMHQVLSVGDCM